MNSNPKYLNPFYSFHAPSLGHLTPNSNGLLMGLPTHGSSTLSIALPLKLKNTVYFENKKRKLQSFFIGYIFEVFNMGTKGLPNTLCYLRIIMYCYSIWNLFFFYSRANSKFSFQLSLIIPYTYPRCRINWSWSYYLVYLISGLTLFQLVVNFKRQSSLGAGTSPATCTL